MTNLTDTKRLPLLDKETEYKLLAQAQAGDDEAIEKLILHNQRLVYSVANKYSLWASTAAQTYDDLVQWGNIGLYTAILRFDLGIGCRLSTYATYWIRSYISRLGHKNFISYHVTFQFLRDCKKVHLGEIKYRKKHQAEPAPEDIAEITGLPVETVEDSLQANKYILSLDEQISTTSGGDRELYDLIPDKSASVEEISDLALHRCSIAEAIQKLPNERWRAIISWKYGIGCAEKSSQEICAELGISRQRVSQIEKEALQKLGTYLKDCIVFP